MSVAVIYLRNGGWIELEQVVRNLGVYFEILNGNFHSA